MAPAENRVRLGDYGRLGADDPRLVAVPSVGKQQRLHWAAARALDSLRKDAAAEGHDIRIASGWRPHRWKSREHYEEVLVSKYGSVQRGQRYLAFNSPHETGLAFDIGTGGLKPVSATIAAQRKTALYRWLVEHAVDHGVTPYNAEPWHWEVRVARSVWDRGGAEPSKTGPLIVGLTTFVGALLGLAAAFAWRG